ncbi:MAG: mucoidy inhibitor MuiA family protein [Anaerolineales bacterium]|nr:mucoidy inhibitor MuiA family protein [Anaerolineales bacterium]
MTTQAIPTQVTAVTVFPDRARVTRSGGLPLQPGLQRLEVTTLPLGLLPDSVRAGGRGTARAKLLGVATRLEHFVDTPVEAARALERRIEEAEDADTALLGQIAVVEKEQKYLDALAAQSEVFARGLALRDRTPDQQSAIFDFVSRRSQRLQAEQAAFNKQRRDLAKALDRLRRELKTIQSARPKQRYVAVVELEVEAAGDFELELTYVVTGANWQPLYDLRLGAAGLDLSYLGQVTQNTGEDWPGAKLTLSTARPSLTLTIPELDPWYLRPRPPLAPVAARAKAGGPQQMVAAAPAPAARPAAEAAPQPQAMEHFAVDDAVVSAAGASLTYALPGAADVPGNGEPRKVTIASLRLVPELTYITAPKLEALCYRRAEIKNTSAYSFLAGPAQLFEGDEYLGATALEFVAPGQTFELVLGADERLRVERELAARDVDKAFILGDRRRIRYAYTITLENLRDTPQAVVVLDQIPVARDEQIKVKLDAADPKPAEQSELNILEWKLTLDRGAKQTLRFDFTVEHPRAMDVIGLI